MTKPKEYPLNRKGWAIIEVQKQGGNWKKCLRPIILTKGVKKYSVENLDPVFYIGEKVNPKTGEKKYFRYFHIINESKGRMKEVSVSRKFCREHNIDYPYYFGTEETRYKRNLIGKYVCDLLYQIRRAPTRAELKKYILQKLHHGQIHDDLTGPYSNSHMRRLMVQCMLEWLPTESKGKKIIELPPPYGLKNEFIVLLFGEFWRNPIGLCSIKLFFQLEKGEEWPPPKKKRGRPRKDTEKRCF